MDFLAYARRRAFSLWLRSGRLPHWARGAPTERKYNPWHDPDDGRFTFKGTGRYFGQRGGASRSADVAMSDRPKEPYGGFAGGGRGFDGGGASGGWTTHEEDARRAREERPASSGASSGPEGAAGRSARRAPRNAVDNPKNWRKVEANGYTYSIDSLGRTRMVIGVLRENPGQVRSRLAQLDAGGSDRRTTDHGGHYIARRFDGPTQAFNHFAQDANFNQSRYFALENQWSRAIRSGKTVEVKIMPSYERGSQRPSVINVWFRIDGRQESLQFPNERKETSNAQR